MFFTLKLSILHSVLLFNILHIIKGEYNIQDSIPSYMYHKFDNIKEEIFPKDIRIKVSLSTIKGTLLYSIDRNMNQLIVSLYDNMEPLFKIEFRKNKVFIPLSEICGCGNCKYEMLELYIEIKGLIYVQCNEGITKKYPYNEIKKLNTVYPIPFSNEKFPSNSNNAAHLWMVNTPYYKDLYPNGQQMLGCIFDVKYRNIPLSFTNTTNNIKFKCVKQCVDNICNGGKCHETYNGKPVCNCTQTFLNGEFCNETITQTNALFSDISFQYNMFKISWKSKSEEIFSLKNLNVQMELRYFGEKLSFEVHNRKNSKNIIFGGYIPNTEHIFVAHLSEKSIDVKLFSNGLWHFESLASKIDLTKEEFSNLTLQSGDGKIGFAYMDSPNNYVWNIFNIAQKEEIKMVSKHNKTNTPTEMTTVQSQRISTNKVSEDITKQGMVNTFLRNGLSLLMIVCFGITIFIILKKRRSNYQKLSKMRNLHLEDSMKLSETRNLYLEDLIQNLSKKVESLKENKTSLRQTPSDIKGLPPSLSSNYVRLEELNMDEGLPPSIDSNYYRSKELNIDEDL